MGMVQIHENLRRKINEINNSNIEDTTNAFNDIYKLYNELLNSISIAFGQPGIKSIEEMADILRKKQAETLLFLVKTAEKKTFRRWVQRTMLAMRTGEYARAKSDSAKNLRNIGMEMDLVQELFQNKNVLLSEAAPHISSIYIGLADACDFFAFMAETHNYEYGQQRSVGGKHPTIGPIDMSKVNYLKKFGKLLTNEAEKMAEIKPEVPGQEKIAQASEEVRLVLSPKAQAVVDLIREVIKAKAPSTTVRIAGGFVRDALLGKESHDIDLAVDNMSGEAFANLVKEYLSEHGERIGEVTIVKANPDQSKNLETAMLKVLGLPIDFVALRNEIYTDNSRIPQVSTSTAEEDAERRDLTINSIFYNINTGKVEDFVGGIQDLKNGIARTPRDPIKTFLDDPLRILRTVRFAAKYNLKLDPDLIKAANTPEVREAFKKKISQERIWMELAGQAEDEGWKAGALMGPNPTQAARLLAQLGLRDIIFDLGDQEKTELGLEGELVPWETNQNNPHHDLNIWEHSLSTLSNLVDQTKEDIKEDKEAYLVRNIAAILHDIGKRYKGIQGIHEKGHTTYHGHEEMSAKMAEKILERLHAPTSIIKKVIKLIGTHLRPHVLSESYTPKSGRKYVTDMGDLWGHGIDLAIADTQGKGTKPGIEQYEVLRRNIEESMPKGESGQMLTSVPLPVTGNDLIEIGIKPGPVMGSILTVLRDRILSNPNLTKEEALSIAKELHDRR
jgi:tRNA nucleotidyltransferase/poly(A) polymerase